MGITREADYKYLRHISINYPDNNYIQIVTERYMVEEDDIAYFTLYTNVRKQGAGS